MKKLIFLPTYNEYENIRRLLPDILNVCADAEILVLDDNSTDGTIAFVKEYSVNDKRVHLWVRSGARGRGLTEIDAYAFFLKNDYDLFLEMDADGSHNVKYIEPLFQALAENDMAIASRFVTGGADNERAWIRSLTSLAIRYFTRIILGISFSDPTSGFRAFRKDTVTYLSQFELHSEGPAIILETAALLSKSGFKKAEIPLAFEARQHGGSKVTARTLRIYAQCVLRQIVFGNKKFTAACEKEDRKERS
jgi:dolichol-phosphate mannosyltransferase